MEQFNGLGKILLLAGLGLLGLGGCEPREITRNSSYSKETRENVRDRKETENKANLINIRTPLMFDELKIFAVYPGTICLGYEKASKSPYFIVHCYGVEQEFGRIFSVWPTFSKVYGLERTPISQEELLEEAIKNGPKEIH